MPSLRFSVNERQRLRVDEPVTLAGGGSEIFRQEYFDRIARFVERTRSPAFTLGYKSVRVGHHVGLLRRAHAAQL